MVTIHDLGARFLPNYHKFPQKYYLNFATEYAIRHANRIVAVSEYTKKDLINEFHPSGGRISLHPTGEIGEKIKVVYEGYDQELFYPRSEEEVVRVKAKYGINGDYFLFVGTIQPRKNLMKLIEAFSLVFKPFARPGLANLVLAGAPGWLYDEIYKAPEKFGVEERVKFPGKVPDEDLPALMSGCKAFVFPSLYEGFGLSLLEAMACGAVTVTSNVTSLPEVGGEAPFYVDPNNIDEIAQALEGVLKLTPEESERIKNRSLNQAKKFSWQESAQQILSLIDSM